MFASSGEAIVWDILRPQLLEADRWRGFKGNPRALSPQADRVAAGITDLAVYDSVTGDPLTPPLQKFGNRSFSRVSFDPGGERLLIMRGESVQVWNLPPDNRPLEDLVALSELLAGRRLSSSGDFDYPPSARMSEHWQKLRAKYPDLFTSSAAQRRLWREDLIQTSQKAGRNFAAVFHLKQLCDENPHESSLRARLGHARNAAALEQVR